VRDDEFDVRLEHRRQRLARRAGLRRRVLLFALAVMIVAGATIAGQARAMLADSLQPAMASQLRGGGGLLAGAGFDAVASARDLAGIERVSYGCWRAS